MQNYPLRAVRQVSYSPDDPSINLLESGISTGTWVIGLCGILAVPMGVALIALARKRKASGKPPEILDVTISPKAAVCMTMLQVQGGGSSDTAMRLTESQSLGQGIGVNVEFVPTESAKSMLSLHAHDMLFVADGTTAKKLAGMTIDWAEDARGGWFYAI